MTMLEPAAFYNRFLPDVRGVFPHYTKKHPTKEPTFESFLGSLWQNVSEWCWSPKANWQREPLLSVSFFHDILIHSNSPWRRQLGETRPRFWKRFYLTLIESWILKKTSRSRNTPPRQHANLTSGLHLRPAAPRVSPPAISRPRYFATVGIPCYEIQHHCERPRLKVIGRKKKCRWVVLGPRL